MGKTLPYDRIECSTNSLLEGKKLEIISRECKVGLGTLSGINKAIHQLFPEIDEFMELKKHYGKDAPSVLSHANDLKNLEQKTGKTYSQVVNDFIQKNNEFYSFQNEIKKLQKIGEETKARKLGYERAIEQDEKILQEKTSKIRNLDTLQGIQDRLFQHNITLQVMDSFIQQFQFLKENGFTLRNAAYFSTELKNQGLDPEIAARTMPSLIRSGMNLKRSIEDLESNLESRRKEAIFLDEDILKKKESIETLQIEKSKFDSTLTDLLKKIDESKDDLKSQQNEAEKALRREKKRIREKESEVLLINSKIEEAKAEYNKFTEDAHKLIGIRIYTSLIENPEKMINKKELLVALLTLADAFERHLATNKELIFGSNLKLHINNIKKTIEEELNYKAT